jgi:hypothetical protein
VCRVGSEFDLHAELAAGLHDAAGAWRFVRRFAARYAGRRIGPGDGWDEEELRAAEARLGARLPAALRAAYALVGRRDELTRVQDRLVTPAWSAAEDPGRVLVFRMENQGVTRWGVPLEAVAEPDPPVVFEAPGERSWRPYLDRVSVACVEMVLSEWLLGGDPGCADSRELDDASLSLLAARFRRLPLPDYPFWPDPDGDPPRWFDAPGAVLREDAGTWLWVRAASPGDLAAVRATLPGGWLGEI